MKKLFLKSFALVAMLLCGLTASASAVDWSPITWASDVTPGSKLANKYKVATPEGVSLVNIQQPSWAKKAGLYITFPDAALGEFRVDGVAMDYAVDGAGVCLYVSNFTAKETEVQVMNMDNSAVRWTLYVYYADGTSSGSETIKPVMGAASLASVTYNSAVVNVAGTDKEEENGKDVDVTRFKVVYGETTKTYTASNEQITITGLTAGTTYSFSIYAVDAAGNVSENSASVSATTESRVSQCSGECGHFGNPTVKRIAYTIAYNPTKETVVYTISALNEKNLDFMEVQNNKGSFGVTIPTEGSTTCTFTQSGVKVGEELAIRFHYSTDEIGLNELTAKEISLSDPNIIYYKVGDCEMVIEEDTEAPVMVSATLVSNTYNSAVIAVEATDNKGVVSYNVVDEANAFNKNFTAVGGKITIDGLNDNTDYNLSIYAVDEMNNVSTTPMVVSFKTEMVIFCDFATGHLGDANFGDANGRILLTLKKMTANKVQVIVKPNTENGATRMLDYLYVVPSGAKQGTYTAGADITEGDGVASLSVEVEYEALPATMNFTLKWSHPAWDGSWVLDVKGVTAEKLCTESEKPTAIDEIGQTISITKTIENGQIVIIREGVRYDMMGRAISK
ncbi:MAG: fibronectin type III domain-containing protein [Paludibacteraceae bacterium]|nr:fibronectin type III domain-containing protein [Paludibacteraceae bacterium]